MPTTINPEMFREYDIRGVVDVDLTPATVRAIGCACGRYFQKAGETTAVVGRDNRLSGPVLCKALIEGLNHAGISVVDIGEVITPAFYYALHYLKINAGVMLTASHNPPEYNGMKVALGPGTIYGEQIQEIYKLTQDNVGEGAAAAEAVAGVRQEDISKCYVQMLLQKIHLHPRKLKVAVDCGNGTAGQFALPFLQGLGCEVIPIYCESDGSFPNHHPDPTHPMNMVDLRMIMLANQCDLGIGFDGDGDRIGVLDNIGRMIWGDKLMVLFWKEILAEHPGADVIVEVKCSQTLVDEVRRLGGKPFFYRTGHSLIKAKMREIGALFAGEMSGHMFFADEYYGYDDALYAAGRLLRILSASRYTMGALAWDMPHYHATAETRIPCADADKFQVVADLTRRFQEEYEVIDVDGARIIFPDGWGLVRCSNTQPVIVARCEGVTEAARERICDVIGAALRSYPSVGGFTWLDGGL